MDDWRQRSLSGNLGRAARWLSRWLRHAWSGAEGWLEGDRRDQETFSGMLASWVDRVAAFFGRAARMMALSLGAVLMLGLRALRPLALRVWEALEPLRARVRPHLKRPGERVVAALREDASRFGHELLAWPGDEARRFSGWLRLGRWPYELAVGAILLFAAFWVTSPAWLLGPTTYLIGGGENPDWTGTAWAYWWTGYAIVHHLNPFDGTWTFFPVGQRPVGQYNLLDGLIGAPMMGLFGPTLGYNAFALFTVWTSGIAVYVLGRSAGASRPASVLAAVGFISSNFFGFELRDGRLSQTLLIFWILGYTGLERLARGLGTWRLAVVTGFMVALTHLVYWYNGLFLIIAATPIWLSEIRRWDLARFRRLGLAAGVTIAMCLPYIVSLAEHFKYLPGTQRALESWMNYGELGRGEFGLNSAIRHSHWPGWPLLHPFLEPDDHRVAAAVLILGFGGLIFARGIPRLRWVATMLTGYVLSLGPYLKGYDGEPSHIRLPYLALYDYFPFFNRLWWPGRMSVIFLLPLLVLAALHLDRLAARLPRLRAMVLVAGILSVLIDIDARNAFVPIMGRTPEIYNQALYQSLDGPIITTPVLGEDPAGRHNLWFQVYHHQPILYGLGAHIASHRPVGYETYIHGNGLLSALAVVSENKIHDSTVTPADVDQLLSDGFRWATVDPTTFTFDYAANYYRNFYEVFSELWGAPDITAGYGLAWRVRPIPSAVTIPAMPPAGPNEYGKTPILPGSTR